MPSLRLFSHLVKCRARSSQKILVRLARSRRHAIAAIPDIAKPSRCGFGDRRFGKLTEAAVQQWQSSHGLVSSGTAATTGYGAVGPKTRAAIASACSGVSSPSMGSAGSPQANTSSNQSLIDLLLAQVKVLQERLAQLIAAKSGGGTTSTYTPPTTYTYNTSSASCNWNGGTVARRFSVAAYQSSSVAEGSQCVSQQRTCTNGTLSGSY